MTPNSDVIIENPTFEDADRSRLKITNTAAVKDDDQISSQEDKLTSKHATLSTHHVTTLDGDFPPNKN